MLYYYTFNFYIAFTIPFNVLTVCIINLLCIICSTYFNKYICSRIVSILIFSYSR